MAHKSSPPAALLFPLYFTNLPNCLRFVRTNVSSQLTAHLLYFDSANLYPFITLVRQLSTLNNVYFTQFIFFIFSVSLRALHAPDLFLFSYASYYSLCMKEHIFFAHYQKFLFLLRFFVATQYACIRCTVQV